MAYWKDAGVSHGLDDYVVQSRLSTGSSSGALGSKCLQPFSTRDHPYHDSAPAAAGSRPPEYSSAVQEIGSGEVTVVCVSNLDQPIRATGQRSEGQTGPLEFSPAFQAVARVGDPWIPVDALPGMSALNPLHGSN